MNALNNCEHYLKEAIGTDERFAYTYQEIADIDNLFRLPDGVNPFRKKYGLEKLTGLTGEQSLPLLKYLTDKLTYLYTDDEGYWLTNLHSKIRYTDDEGHIIDSNSVSELNRHEYNVEVYDEPVFEGYDESFLEPTAALTVKILDIFISMAERDPDGVWSIS